MVKFVTGALLAGVASMALSTAAIADGPTIPDGGTSDKSYKCEAATSSAGPKFVAKKASCVTKCLKLKWKAGVADTSTANCLSQTGYADTAANHCVTGADTPMGTDPKAVDGAEEKFSLAQVKKCQPDKLADFGLVNKPAVTDSCPACYTDPGNQFGGEPDCSLNGYAGDNTGYIEGLVDQFGFVFCQSSAIGAFPLQQKCELQVASSLGKYNKTVNKCYDKCVKLAVKNKALVPPGPVIDCSSNAAVDTALDKGDGKKCIADAAALAKTKMDAKCSLVTGATPSCYSIFGGTDGAIGLVDTTALGAITNTYCGN